MSTSQASESSDPAAYAEAQLAAFEARRDAFAEYFQAYQRQELGFDDMTRHLSEATAEAELFLSEHSAGLSLAQLQRYAGIQKSLDTMTFELFKTEIARNRAIMAEAIRNGEYFIVGLTFSAIRSSIFMMYAKHKIKTEQEQALASLEQEQKLSQSLLRVLKAIEGVIDEDQADATPSTPAQLHKVQKALELYVSYFAALPADEIRLASDERLFRLCETHVDTLFEAGDDPESLARIAPHLAACCRCLESLAASPLQQQLLEVWRSLIPTESGPEAVAPPDPEAARREQKQRMAALEQELAGKARFKVLHDLETAIASQDAGQPDYPSIQQQLAIYADYFKHAEHLASQAEFDQRVYDLFDSHMNFLCLHDFCGDADAAALHILACCDMLALISQTEGQAEQLGIWRALAASIDTVGNGLAEPDQQESLAALELEAGQILIRRLEAFDAALALKAGNLPDYRKIQLALERYATASGSLRQIAIKLSCDQHLFSRFEAHVDSLFSDQDALASDAHNAHLIRCCALLQPLARSPFHQQLLTTWHSLTAE